MTVAWGLLSTAAINDRILPGLRESSEFDIVAVASRDRDRAQAYVRERGIERAHGGYDALLADPEIDAVYVNVPNSMHVEWTLRALEAGKHVLCEKPISPRTADVDRVFALAEDRGLVVMEAFMYRHNPQTLELERLVRAGAVGELQTIRASFRFAAGDPADIRLSPELEGGSLMDVGSYCVNLARLLAGEPREAIGHAVIGPSGVDVRFYGTLRFAGDVVAQFDNAVTLPFRAEIEVAGDRGSLRVSDPWLCREPGIVLERDGEVRRIEIEPADSYRLEFENLGAVVRGEAAPRLGAADARGQAATLEALFRSAREGRAVALDEVLPETA